MPTYSQEGRLLAINTPLGKDELLLTAFTGKEEMSRLFSFQLDLLSEKPDIEPKDIVGKNVTFTVYPGEAAARHFNGFVSRFAAGGLQVNDLRFYRAEVVPWLWFLTRTADCRIFQNKSVPDIIQQIFKDLGFTDFKVLLKGDHPKRDYCVQYRETDFNFASRLMEEEGIFYYFQHEDGKHTLMIDDQKSGYKDCTEKEVQFYVGTIEESHVTHWEHQFEFRPGKWAQTDYNFETPSTSLMTTVPTLVKLPDVENFEIYDYPGEYAKKDDGDKLTKIRMEEDEAAYDVVHAASNCSSFYPGGKFMMKQHPVKSEAGKAYVITAIQHSATDASYTPGAQGDQDYSNTFTCIPDSVLFRPARITPKPVVQGVQTAVIVGPPGEEIHTDKYSRVKVQFHWDREGNEDENSSCWIRVSQAYAGSGWGAMCIPRIGQEVIVDFLEGDPDRPIITGRVYNAEQMPPYGLPGDKVVSGLKSNSSPGGGGYNEFIMNDTKGKEMIRTHAQFDMDTTVEHDQSTTVHNNRTDKIDVDDSETVGSNQTISIGSNQTISIGSNQKVEIGSNQETKIGSNQTINIGAEQKLDVGAAQKITVGAARTTDVAANDELTVGADQKIDVSGAVNITAGASITLTVEDSSIEIKPGAITIKTGGTVTIEGAAKVETKGGAITAQADGDHEVKGATVKIN